MSKTVSGYMMIEGITYGEMLQNPLPCVEAFVLAQEAGIIPQDLHIYVGTTRMYDGKVVEGIVVKGRGITQQLVITKEGVVYDDMLDEQLKTALFEVLKFYVPANYKVEEMKKRVKGTIKGEKKRIQGTKILLEVELS